MSTLDDQVANACKLGDGSVIFKHFREAGSEIEFHWAKRAIRCHRTVLTIAIISRLVKYNKLSQKDLDYSLRLAAAYGNEQLIYILLNVGANCINWALQWAACNGHMRVVKLCVLRGATKFRNPMRFCKDTHPEIYNYLRDLQSKQGDAFQVKRDLMREKKTQKKEETRAKQTEWNAMHGAKC